MSERSELRHDGAFFVAAKRRHAHWCPVIAEVSIAAHESMVHQ
jgi:hypothetical protein